MTTTRSGPRVWITRAEPGASRTADRVAALGYVPVVVPLLVIRPIAQTVPDLDRVTALVFTSRNGVAAFADLTPERDRPVFAVGDATAQAARAVGFADVRSACGDLTALAALIAGTTNDPQALLLHPSARYPAGDLGGRLAGRVRVHTLPVYEAVETGVASPETIAVILIHSPRAAQALAKAVSRVGAMDAVVVAISKAAAAPLAALGFAATALATTPDETALLKALTQTLGKPTPAV